MDLRTLRHQFVDDDSRFVDVDDLSLHYKRTGRGRALLLLHGSGSSLHAFDPVAERLSPRAEVIRLDLPGFGLTGARPDRDYRIARYTATIRDFLVALAVPKAVVVGSSLGGNIAWNLALDAPEAVAGLVLVNATGYPGKSLPLPMRLARSPVGRVVLRRLVNRPSVERSLRSAVGGQSRGVVTAAVVDRVYAMMSLPSNRQAFIDLARTDQLDRSRDIPLITTPTLVLRSAVVDGQHFVRDIPSAREFVHATGGHLLPEEDPDWVACGIERFLDTCEVDR